MYWVEIHRFFIRIFCFHAFGRVYQKLIWSVFFTINSFFKNSLNSHLFYGESLRFTFRRETWTSGETWDQREPEPTFGVNFHVSPLVHGSRHGVRRKLWCKNWNEGSCLTVVCTSDNRTGNRVYLYLCQTNKQTVIVMIQSLWMPVCRLNKRNAILSFSTWYYTFP